MFEYFIEGSRWIFAAKLMDLSSTNRPSYVFDNSYIEMFEYDNQLNNFLLTGQMVYRDVTGQLGKFFRLQHLFVSVWWSEQKFTYIQKNRETDEGPVPDGEAGKEIADAMTGDQFSHLFMVNKIEIIRHEMPSDTLVYRLELISAYWYQFSAICHWSNYADKEPWPITKIICDILNKTVGENMVDQDSFLNDHNRTELKIFYITTEQDNAITAINYLLNRLYMEPASFDTDNHLRVIVFDEWTNKWRMVNLNNDQTFLKARDYMIQLDRFWNVVDKEVNPYDMNARARGERTQVTSVSKLGYTKSIEEFYTRSYWDINIIRDKFVRKYIESDKIVNLFLHTIQDKVYEMRPATFNIAHETNYKLHPSLLSDGYIINESAWNNKRHIYSDQLYRLCNRDTFEVNKNNRVNHQPGQLFFVPQHEDQAKKEYVDKDKLEEMINGSPEKSNETVTGRDLMSDRQLFGYWFTTKVRHIAFFYDTHDENAQESPRFLESISMMKYNSIMP
jgi:hypothetical protein